MTKKWITSPADRLRAKYRDLHRRMARELAAQAVASTPTKVQAHREKSANYRQTGDLA